MWELNGEGDRDPFAGLCCCLPWQYSGLHYDVGYYWPRRLSWTNRPKSIGRRCGVACLYVRTMHQQTRFGISASPTLLDYLPRRKGLTLRPGQPWSAWRDPIGLEVLRESCFCRRGLAQSIDLGCLRRFIMGAPDCPSLSNVILAGSVIGWGQLSSAHSWPASCVHRYTTHLDARICVSTRTRVRT
jgi:hypothetical protein